MKTWICSIFFIGSFLGLGAQSDSLTLRMDRLGREDVKVNEQLLEKQRVVSASRSLKTVAELPFTIYVVTKEEIFKNGYTTLVDVLKSVPGIKVSQPGSALEGETFMMRGLLGNAYTKILINDLPVKPSVVSGMPIGAQLPIKEAERIEIIFGPGAAIYGADASAGIVNIITAQTEKPIYAQADLSIGNDAYTNIDVMFGGKLGKGKRILKFSIYGSTTEFNNRNNIYSRDVLYNPETYLGEDTSSINVSNFSGSIDSIRINNLPHLSRLFGVQLKYRAFNFSLQKMYRRDHSSIGLNPRSVSYANPLNFQAETINRINFGIDKDYKNIGLNFNLNYLGFIMDTRSSSTYVDNNLSRLLDKAVKQFVEDPSQQDSIAEKNYEDFFSGNRYSYSESHDLYLEQLFTIHPSRFYEVIAGLNWRMSYNQPYTDYLRTPFPRSNFFSGDDNLRFIETPVFPSEELNFNYGGFAQLYLTLKRLNLIAGIRYDNFSRWGTSSNPRLALLYKIGKKSSLRASYATAFRVPSPFYSANTYTISFQDTIVTNTGNPAIRPEKTTSYEFGSRLNWNDRVTLDMGFFYSETKNFLSTNEINISDEAILVGYFNDRNSKMFLYGLQSRIRFNNFWTYYDFNGEISWNISKGREVLPFGRGRIDRVRLQPTFSGQVKFSFNFFRKFYLYVNNVYSTGWVKRSVPNQVDYQENPDSFKVKGFYTLDLMLRLQMTTNFHAYLKINNFFGKEYGGIGATGLPDDLIFNPQPTSSIQMGMSYRMN